MKILAADHVEQDHRFDARLLLEQQRIAVLLDVALAAKQGARGFVPVPVEALFSVEKHQLNGRFVVLAQQDWRKRQQ